jgi:uncharacterized protein (TIGR02186 family)
LAALAGIVRAETMVVSLSAHRISITSTYAGAELALFGAIERDARTIARASAYDIVVSVRGPAGTVMVQKKDRVGFVWINREQRRYANMPTFLSVLSSRAINEFATPEILRRLEIGLTGFLSPADAGIDLDSNDSTFRLALFRLKTNEGLYRQLEGSVTFLTPTIFQAPLRVPPSAPTGNYTVDVALFADGAVLSRHRTHFEVVKAGTEAFVAEAARDKPWSYGFVAAGIAIMFGWLASIAFRRD